MDLFRVAADWKQPLQKMSMAGFAQLWNMPQNWAEGPKFQRRGWGGVSRLILVDAEGTERTAYLKRQDGQLRRGLCSRGLARPTYYNELMSLRRFQALGVPVVDWVCYGERGAASLLVTVFPEGFISLAELAERRDDPLLDAALKAVVDALGTLHRFRWQHGSCYPAHVLINPETLEVRFMDLARCRRHLTVASATSADLRQLVRHGDAFLDRGRVELIVKEARLRAPGINGDSLAALTAR